MLTYRSSMVLSPKTLTYPLVTPLENLDLNAYEPCLFLLGLESCVDMSFEKYEAKEVDYYRLLDRDLINHNEAAALLAGINPRFIEDILRFEEADPSGRLATLDKWVGTKAEQFPTEIAPLVREAKIKISELKEKVAYQFPGHWVERS